MINKSVMPNGIRVVTDSMSEVRSVTIGLWFDCGSRQDEKNLSGTAHFIEHIMLKGTKKRDAKKLALDTDLIGGQMNAFTSHEYTCFYMKVLDIHTKEAFDILSDMMLNSLFKKSDIIKEKKIILQEYDMYEDNPEDLIQDEFFSFAWKGHSLGRNITGNRKSIKNIEKDGLEAFKKDFYTPDNLVIAVAGNIKHDEICDMVGAFFSEAKGQHKKHDKSAPVFHSGCKHVSKNIEQLQLLWGVPGISIFDENWYAATVLNNILGSSSSSRLFQKMREEKGLTYFIYSSLDSYSDTGLLTISAAIKPKKKDEFMNLLDIQIGSILNDGITDEELKRAKEQIKSNILMGLESSGGRMNRIGKLSVMKRPIYSLEEIAKKIDVVQKSDVHNIADFLLKDANPAILLLGPAV